MLGSLNGAKATGFADEVALHEGRRVLVDLDRVTRDPWIDPEFDIAGAFVERALGADVVTVVIGGKVVVEDHRARTIDVEGLYREVPAFCAKSLTPERYALSLDIDTLVLGVKNRTELAECVAAADAGPLPPELMARVDGAVPRDERT